MAWKGNTWVLRWGDGWNSHSEDQLGPIKTPVLGTRHSSEGPAHLPSPRTLPGPKELTQPVAAVGWTAQAQEAPALPARPESEQGRSGAPRPTAQGPGQGPAS